MKTNSLFKVLSFFFLAITISCSEYESRSQPEIEKDTDAEFTVIAINPYEFFFNDQEEGGAITFNSKEFKQCDLSFIKSKFKPGYHTKTNVFGEGDIDLSCLNEQANFAMSPAAPTYIEMTVGEVSNQTGSVQLSFSLYSVRTKQRMERTGLSLKLNQNQLSTLLNESRN